MARGQAGSGSATTTAKSSHKGKQREGAPRLGKNYRGSSALEQNTLQTPPVLARRKGCPDPISPTELCGPWQAAKSFKASNMRAGTRSTTPVAWLRLEHRRSCFLTDKMTIKAARHTAAHTRGCSSVSGGSNSQTCLGSSSTPCGSCLCRTFLTSRTPAHPQRTCSLSWRARTVMGAAWAGNQPKTQPTPFYGDHPWPPAPTTPCWIKPPHLLPAILPVQALPHGSDAGWEGPHQIPCFRAWIRSGEVCSC